MLNCHICHEKVNTSRNALEGDLVTIFVIYEEHDTRTGLIKKNPSFFYFLEFAFVIPLFGEKNIYSVANAEYVMFR